MSPRSWKDEWVRNAGMVVVVMTVLSLVLLTVFLYLVPLVPAEGDQQEARYHDPRYGFELTVPARWRRAEVSDEDRTTLAADYDVVWEDPDNSARLAVSAWDGRAVASFVLWAPLVAGGMQPIDGQTPYNAYVAG